MDKGIFVSRIRRERDGRNNEGRIKKTRKEGRKKGSKNE